MQFGRGNIFGEERHIKIHLAASNRSVDQNGGRKGSSLQPEQETSKFTT